MGFFIEVMQEELEKAIAVLEKGGVLIYPTDTVWGMGCDATNPTAVEKLSELKNRGEGKSYIVLLDDDRKLNRYVKEVPEVAWDILDYANRPTTIVYPQGVNLAKNVLGKDGSVAIRIVKDGFVKRLLQRFKKPIVSTSANFSGEPSPKNYKDISNSIKEKVDGVVSLPEEQAEEKPSAIIKLQIDGQVEIIRK